jgi:pimeloyl-ACP methyl ester carboxylesterase
MSVDTWRLQIYSFLLEVMKASHDRPAYVIGNSLGGYLAVQLAALHPEIVRGVVLMNATPFWGFKPPLEAQQGFWSMLPSGSIPIPQVWFSHLQHG